MEGLTRFMKYINLDKEIFKMIEYTKEDWERGLKRCPYLKTINFLFKQPTIVSIHEP
jgi:hypothetical protein